MEFIACSVCVQIIFVQRIRVALCEVSLISLRVKLTLIINRVLLLYTPAVLVYATNHPETPLKHA